MEVNDAREEQEEAPQFLVGCGITSMSVTPDTVMQVCSSVSKAEAAAREKVLPRDDSLGIA